MSVVTVAITRPTGVELRECELTHGDRVPIDVERACKQHDDYQSVLRSLGVHVVEGRCAASAGRCIAAG